MAVQYKLEGVRVHGRFLFFQPISSCPCKSPIAIPFGSVVDPKGHKFILETSGDRLKRIIAIPEKQWTSIAEIQIWPPYKKKERISTSGLSNIGLEVWQVQTDIDRAQAVQIITRSHYLNAPFRGLILGCRFIDTEVQKQVRKLAKSSENPEDLWSDAWDDRPGRMIACAVLDTLFHGNPSGRREIAMKEKASELLKGHWHEQDRRVIIDRLSIAWASRFAVDAPYRGIGVGTVLAKHLIDIANKHRVPQAKYIEAITTIPAEKEKAILESKRHGFLERAGFIRSADVYSSRPLLQADPQTGEEAQSITSKKLYYYIKSIA